MDFLGFGGLGGLSCLMSFWCLTSCIHHLRNRRYPGVLCADGFARLHFFLDGPLTLFSRSRQRHKTTTLGAQLPHLCMAGLALELEWEWASRTGKANTQGLVGTGILGLYMAFRARKARLAA